MVKVYNLYNSKVLLILLIGLMGLILCSAYVNAACPNPSHNANQICAGTFADSSPYTFPQNLNVNNNLVVSGNLGVGTSPTQKLDVAGNILCSSGITSVQWCSKDYDICAKPRSNNYFDIRDKADSAYKGLAAQRLWVEASQTALEGSSGYFYVSDVQGTVFTGNVGIGATSPSQKLDVAGTAVVDYLSVDPQDGTNEGGEIQLKGAGSYGTFQIDNYQGHARIQTLASGKQFQVLGGGAYFDGNVGIGTLSPGQKLVVRESTSTTNSLVSTAVVSAYSTGNMADGFGPELLFNIADSGASNEVASIAGIRDAADNGGALTFNTRYWGTWGERMRITRDGSVGVGTPSPAYKLDVNGVLRLQAVSAPTGANGVIYYDSSTNKFRCYQNGAWVDCIGSGAGGIGGSGTATQVAFFTGGTNIGSDSNLFWDNTNKRLGIGTTTPGQMLDVNGNIRASGDIIPGNNGVIRAIVPLAMYDGVAYVNSNTAWTRITRTSYTAIDGLFSGTTTLPSATRKYYLVIRKADTQPGGDGSRWRFRAPWAGDAIGHGFTVWSDWGSLDEGTTSWIEIPPNAITGSGCGTCYWTIDARMLNAGREMRVYSVSMVAVDVYGGSNIGYTAGTSGGSIGLTNSWLDSTIYQTGGNIGIGTASPQRRLHVASNANDLSGGAMISASDYSTNGGYLILNKNSGSGSYATIQSGDSAAYRALALNPIDGNVGIGTTNPQSKLDVNGDVRLNGVIKSVSGNVIVQLGP
jgi:hypothetical protein